MIQLTRINNTSLVLNADLIEQIETTPDTLISLTNGQKFVVRESVAEVMDKAIEYQRQIRQLPATPVGPQISSVEVASIEGAPVAEPVDGGGRAVASAEPQDGTSERNSAGQAAEDQG